MKELNWQTVIRWSPLIAAFAAVLTALVGDIGLYGFLKDIVQKDDAPLHTTTSNSSEKVRIQFYCEKTESELATVVANSQKDTPIRIINWDLANDYFGEEWPPHKRCEVVSERFQKIHDRDAISFLTVDISNWHSSNLTPVVCGIKSKGSRCLEEDLLFTLQNEDDPNEILTQLIALRQNPETNKEILRGDETTFDDGVRIYYDLKHILKVSDSEQNKKETPAF